jgi:multidrug efflux system membrane fusion protein
MNSHPNVSLTKPTPEPKPAAKTSDSQPRKRRWTVWIAAVCVLLGGGTYLLSQRADSTGSGGGGKSGGKTGGKGSGAIPVSVEKVTVGNMGVYITGIGTVTPVYTVTVASRVAGELMEVRYREGQIVHKGDVLAIIDARPYQAVYVQAQGQLARDQALLQNARIDLKRYTDAYTQHAIPEQTLATQKATVDQDEGTTKLDQGNLDAAKVNVDYAQITSPIDGRVGLRTVDPGNLVPANGTTGLVTITQLQPITVIFPMPEDNISDVVAQMRAGHKLRVDAFDRSNQKDIAQGTVLTLDNQIDTTTGTVRVRATFANKDNQLFPNEFVNARLLVKTLMQVNIIPTAAIQHNNDVSFVYVVNPATNAVQSRNVTVASTDGLQSAATGVKAGEILVTDGFDKLDDGTKVRARAPAAANGSTNNSTAQGSAQ